MKLEHMGHKSRRSTGAEPRRSHTRRVNDNPELSISHSTPRGVATAVACEMMEIVVAASVG
jgi:hypothetical protein